MKGTGGGPSEPASEFDRRTWMTTEDLAERFRTSPGTLRYWRHMKYGPRGVKVGRRVLYSSTDVERWEAEQLDAAGRMDSA